MDACIEADKAPYEGLWVHLEANAGTHSRSSTTAGAYPFELPPTTRSDSAATTTSSRWTAKWASLAWTKCAPFKLGNHFAVKSVAADSSFRLDVPVEPWVQDKDKDSWHFPLLDPVEGAKQAAADRGTDVVVDELHPSVSREIASERFVSRLATQIEMRHERAISAGMQIKVNGTELAARPPQLLASELVRPQVVERDLEMSDGQKVSMRLCAGFVTLADEDADTDNPQEFRGAAVAGWYLSCNGRLLLFANRARLTGWARRSLRITRNIAASADTSN